MEEFSEIFFSHFLTMDSKMEHIFVLLSVFMVMMNVIMSILALQKL